MTVLNTVLPLVGIVLGAGITFVLNVREQRDRKIDDLFSEAIASVSAAEITIDYTAGINRPSGLLSDKAWAELQEWFVLEGLKRWWQAVEHANEALARVRPYQPEVSKFLPLKLDAQHREIDAVLDALRLGPG